MGAFCNSVFRVNRFWEKPTLEIARKLLDRGCLWNTFVMIGRGRTFLDALRQSVPEVFRAFERAPERRAGRIDADRFTAALPRAIFRSRCCRRSRTVWRFYDWTTWAGAIWERRSG